MNLDWRQVLDQYPNDQMAKIKRARIYSLLLHKTILFKRHFHQSDINYCMSKKSLPFLNSRLLYKMVQDFFDIQYSKETKCFHIFISCPFPVMDTWFKKLLIKNIMNNHQTLKELRKQLLLRGKAATASKSIKKSLIDMYSEVGLVFFSIIIFLYIWLYLYTIQTHTADHK